MRCLRIALRIPKPIRDIEDSFSKELIELWDKRGLTGGVFWYEEDGKPLCYILVQEGGYTNTIRGFFTIPEARGKGLGFDILTAVYNHYEMLGAYAMVVNITEGAEKVYERAGFTILGRRKDFSDQKIAFKGILSDSEERELERKLA